MPTRGRVAFSRFIVNCQLSVDLSQHPGGTYLDTTVYECLPILCLHYAQFR